jgi:hypothetical protein
MMLWLKIVIWYPIAALLYPVLSAPMMLPMMLVRPLQLLCVLTVTGLRAISLELAIAFIVLVSLWYSWTVLIPPRDARGYAQWVTNRSLDFFGRLSQITLMVTMLVAFVCLMEFFDFNVILRWLASFGIAYYLAGVAAGILMMPPTVAAELRQRRIPDTRA